MALFEFVIIKRGFINLFNQNKEELLMDRKLLRLLISLLFLIGGIVFLFKQEFIYAIGFFVVAGIYFLCKGKSNE